MGAHGGVLGRKDQNQGVQGPLEAETGEEMDSPEPLGGTGPTNSLILAPQGAFQGLAWAAHLLTWER